MTCPLHLPARPAVCADCARSVAPAAGVRRTIALTDQDRGTLERRLHPATGRVSFRVRAGAVLERDRRDPLTDRWGQ